MCACFGLISWDEHLEGHRPSTSTPAHGLLFLCDAGDKVLLFQWYRSSTSPTNVVISMYVMLLIGGRFSLVGNMNMKKRVGNILRSWTRITIQQSNSYASAPPHVNMDHSKPTQKTSAHFFLLNLHGMSMWWSIYLACPIAVCCTMLWGLGVYQGICIIINAMLLINFTPKL